MKTFIDREKLLGLTAIKPPTKSRLDEILSKAMKLKGLDLQEAAELLQVTDAAMMNDLLKAAGYAKREIYGRRMVLFAPLYVANECSNNCLYCGFRRENKSITRRILSTEEIKAEVSVLLREGHKRLLMLTGESADTPVDYFLNAIRTAYSVKDGSSSIRRINVEIAPLDEGGFSKLKDERIGTYACFQETYDPVVYSECHPSGPKADYEYRLYVMDRAMRGGVNDVGIGALFGLTDYRFEVLSMIEHAAHLEKEFDCGPHTVSVPRIEPADNAPLTHAIPNPVSDDEFRKIIAVIRLAMPYTGMILSTRENESLRRELFQYGISQISAGSRTNPGAYSETGKSTSGSQFSLGDHRSLDEVISGLLDEGYIPSFCTGCYRRGRIGPDFMDLAKIGDIKRFCEPNAVFTLTEYLMDYAGTETKKKGFRLINELLIEEQDQGLRENMRKQIESVKNGERDVYF